MGKFMDSTYFDYSFLFSQSFPSISLQTRKQSLKEFIWTLQNPLQYIFWAFLNKAILYSEEKWTFQSPPSHSSISFFIIFFLFLKLSLPLSSQILKQTVKRHSSSLLRDDCKIIIRICLDEECLEVYQSFESTTAY